MKTIERIERNKIRDSIKSRSQRLILKSFIMRKIWPEWIRIRESETRSKSGFFFNNLEFKVYSS